MQTLLIDHHDSYTYNLVELLRRVNGKDPFIVQHDEVRLTELQELDFDNVVISSGPGHPNNKADFQLSMEAIKQLNVPILGISLGHEGIAACFGAEVVQADHPGHGLTSGIFHNQEDLFAHIPNPFKAVRYHSLIVDAKSMPAHLEKIAWTKEGDVMGIRHIERPIWGVQYQPDSVETEYGEQLIQNFIDLTKSWQQNNPPKEMSTLNNKKIIEQKSGSFKKQPTQSSYTVHVEKIDHLYDPETVFVELYGEKEKAFWLDSSRVEKGMARFSFIGSADGPLSEAIRYDLVKNVITKESGGEVEQIEQDVFSFLNEEMRERFVESDVPFDFNTGYVGYFGYELKSLNGGDIAHKAKTPDAYLLFADQIIAFDHEEKATYLLEFTRKKSSKSNWFAEMKEKLEQLSELEQVNRKPLEKTLTFELSRNKAEYMSDIREIQEKIKNGETYEVTLTNEITTKLDVDSLDLYRLLRKTNPAPYAAYIRFDDVAILSSSPERFVKVDKERQISAKPIKGTIKRGENEAEDENLLQELKNSEKNRAENLMIVDVLRHELGLVSEPGTVHVEKLMDVESYETVHQLVSTVTGLLRKDTSVVDLVRATYAGGSMTGAPKIRSMQILDELEKRPRGIYSGAVGFIGLNGAMDLSIVIRSIVKVGNELSMGVGGAITLLSDALEEYEEMLLKAEALIEAIEGYVSGDERLKVSII